MTTVAGAAICRADTAEDRWFTFEIPSGFHRALPDAETAVTAAISKLGSGLGVPEALGETRALAFARDLPSGRTSAVWAGCVTGSVPVPMSDPEFLVGFEKGLRRTLPAAIHLDSFGIHTVAGSLQAAEATFSGPNRFQGRFAFIPRREVLLVLSLSFFEVSSRDADQAWDRLLGSFSTPSRPPMPPRSPGKPVDPLAVVLALIVLAGAGFALVFVIRAARRAERQRAPLSSSEYESDPDGMVSAPEVPCCTNCGGVTAEAAVHCAHCGASLVPPPAD